MALEFEASNTALSYIIGRKLPKFYSQFKCLRHRSKRGPTRLFCNKHLRDQPVLRPVGKPNIEACRIVPAEASQFPLTFAVQVIQTVADNAVARVIATPTSRKNYKYRHLRDDSSMQADWWSFHW
ncbi:hypothetical protein HAX54_011334 [Datura stramonium]|uniref:Uncharacterized protein n=1 Tax=Datura stramonium TaxID=4076 RepID=A0ABS8TKH9_DATST|nr:hypothetical protein [Datura stramonium]